MYLILSQLFKHNFVMNKKNIRKTHCFHGLQDVTNIELTKSLPHLLINF